MAEKILLKNLLFNRAKVERIAEELRQVHASFQKCGFVRDTLARFPDLELKARISWIAQCLKQYLPRDYRRAVGIMVEALPPPNDPSRSDDDFGDFIYASYAEYVAQNGCALEHLPCSFDALRELTQRFSAEDAIRYFLNAFPRQTLKTLLAWSTHPYYHVRRLASEGTRPKLPWSQKIAIPIDVPIRLLDKLFCDSTRYVTRSVANHVNDISKLDPDLAMDMLTKWRKSGKQQAQEMDYIVRHALRTLIKQGNPRAMRMLGFDHAVKISVSKLHVPRRVKMNTALEFSFSIQSKERVGVLIDYTLTFRNKNGKPGGRKVFKLTKLALAKNTPMHVAKRHPLRQFMTTRTLHPGKHEVAIQVNGKPCANASFLLEP